MRFHGKPYNKNDRPKGPITQYSHACPELVLQFYTQAQVSNYWKLGPLGEGSLELPIKTARQLGPLKL